jgi:hypothetical protein
MENVGVVQEKTKKRRKFTQSEAFPRPLLDPSWVQINKIVEMFGNWGTIPGSSTKKG